jgi:hypothetical protein
MLNDIVCSGQSKRGWFSSRAYSCWGMSSSSSKLVGDFDELCSLLGLPKRFWFSSLAFEQMSAGYSNYSRQLL